MHATADTADVGVPGGELVELIYEARPSDRRGSARKIWCRGIVFVWGERALARAVESLSCAGLRSRGLHRLADAIQEDGSVWQKEPPSDPGDFLVFEMRGICC